MRSVTGDDLDSAVTVLLAVTLLIRTISRESFRWVAWWARWRAMRKGRS